MKLRNTSILFTIALLAIAMSAMAAPCSDPAQGPPVAVTTANSVTQTLCYGPANLSFTAPPGAVALNDLFTFATFDPATLGAGQVLLGIKITFTADFTASLTTTAHSDGDTVIVKLEDHGKLCQPDSDPTLCFAPAFGQGPTNSIDDLSTLEGFKVEEVTLGSSGNSFSDNLSVASPNTSTNVGGQIINGVETMGANQTHMTQTITLVGTGPQGLGGSAAPFVGTGHTQGTGSASPYTYYHTAPPGVSGPTPGGNINYDIGDAEVVVPVNFVGFSTVAGDLTTCPSIEATYGLAPFACSSGPRDDSITSTGQATVTIEYDFGSATPEPGSLILLGSGLTALASLIRRKVSKS